MSEKNNGGLKTFVISLTERFAPIIISFVFFLICLLGKLNLGHLKDYKVLFTNTISFASIFIGIITTMATLFLGYSGKQVVREIKEYNADNILSKYFSKPIFLGLVLVIASMMLPNIIEEKVISNIEWLNVISSLWVSIATFFILATIRILWLMLGILRSVFNEDTNEAQEEKTDEVEVHFEEDIYNK